MHHKSKLQKVRVCADPACGTHRACARAEKYPSDWCQEDTASASPARVVILSGKLCFQPGWKGTCKKKLSVLTCGSGSCFINKTQFGPYLVAPLNA